MSLSITAVYTAVFAILIVPMSLQITLRRIALGNLALGDGKDEELIRKRETLRNFCEYVPLGLILLAVYESTFGSIISVIVFGGMFLFSRILHIIGLQHFVSPKYFGVAMVVQHTYFILASGMLIYDIRLK